MPATTSTQKTFDVVPENFKVPFPDEPITGCRCSGIEM